MMVDWAERAVCILLSLAILANAMLVRRMVSAWAFPAVIFSLAWFFYTIIPLVFFPNAHVYPLAMLYILCATIAVSLGSISNWKKPFARASELSRCADRHSTFKLNLYFFSSFLITIVCLLLNSVSQGISIDQLLNNINASAAEYAGRRYAFDIVPNIYHQVGNVLAYFCAGMGGILIVSEKRRSRKLLILFASLSPAVFVMLSQSARGMLFLCAAIFYGGILVAGLRQNNTNLISKRAIPALIALVLITLPLVTVSFIARGVSYGAGQDFIDAIAPYWASYTSGHLFAFSDWFGNYTGRVSAQAYDNPGMTNGFYTFMSIFKLFGDDRLVPIGVYGEYLTIPPYIGTNIYTVFRGMIHDFGIFGSLILISLLSYASHLSFRVMLNSVAPSFSIAAFLFTMAFIYQSFIISALMWSTLIAGTTVVGIVMRLSQLNPAHKNAPGVGHPVSYN